MEKISVIRLRTSPYFDSNFLFFEKNELESLRGVEFGGLELAEKAKKVVLITDTHTQVHSLPPSLFPKIQLVLHPNSGVDNLVSTSIFENIPVIIGKELRAQAVAEYIWARIWKTLVRIPTNLVWDEKRSWERGLLEQKKILIVGQGTVGKILQHWLSPLPLTLETFDPFKKVPIALDLAEIKKTFLQLLEVFSPDIVILACSLNPSSRKMIDRQCLNLLKNNVTIINPARGELIDEKALLHFLRVNPNARAYLDVFEKEPAPLAEYSTYENLVGTSHLAGVYSDLGKKTIEWEKKILYSFLTQDSSSFKRSYAPYLLENCQISLSSGEQFFI